MKKIITYARYFYDYLKHGDFGSIIASIRFVLNGKTHSKDRIIETSIGRFLCRKNTNDFQFANYYYEWGVKKYFMKHLRNYDVFLDAGTCIGDYAVLAAKAGVRTIAFEPISGNYEAMVRNLGLNQLEGEVQTYQVGLGKANEQLVFEIDPVNTGASHKSIHQSGLLETVQIRTIDSLLPEFNLKKEDRILFMFDMEGMELEAIEGSRQFLKEYPNLTLIFEKKHSGEKSIEYFLSEIDRFEFEVLDEFNILAQKKSQS